MICNFLRRLALSSVLAASIICSPRSTSAAIDTPLADKVPSDALVYVGWCGAEKAGELYDGSHAQALLRASEFPAVFDRVVPVLLDRLGREDDEARPWTDFLTDVYPILYRHPTALAFGGVDWNAPNQPVPKLLLVCEAGPEAVVLRNELTQLFQSIGRIEFVTLIDVQDGVLYMNVGWQKLDLALADENPVAGLAASDRFVSATQGLLDTPVKTLFIDVPGVISLIEEGMRKENQEDQLRQFAVFLDSLGLRGLGSVAMTTGFVDGLYRTDAFIETRGARTGLLAMLDGEGLDEHSLGFVPADAGLVVAARLDPIRLLDTVRNAVLIADPNAVGDFEQGLGFINGIVGTDIEHDFLEAAGDTWAAYIAPATGDTLLGAVAVNKPDDATRFRSAMTNLSMSLTTISNQQFRQKGEPFRLEGRLAETGTADIYSLDLPMVAPTWAVSDSAALFGFYPQSVAAAMMTAEGDGFTGTASFTAIKEMAGGATIVGFTYADLPRFSGRSYALLNAYLQLGGGMLGSFGEAGGLNVRMPAMTLPPYPIIREHLSPAVSVSWVDDRGLHYRSREPFPLSSLLLAGMN